MNGVAAEHRGEEASIDVANWLKTQLTDRYLQGGKATHRDGIYLVCWFDFASLEEISYSLKVQRLSAKCGLGKPLGARAVKALRKRPGGTKIPVKPKDTKRVRTPYNPTLDAG